MAARSPLHKSLLSITLALVGIALVDTAAAQPPEQGPDEVACSGKQIGEACSLANGQAGACGQGTCSRLDYSGGSPPKAIEESCVVCLAGVASVEPPSLGSGGDGSSGSAGGEQSDTAKTDEPDDEVDDPPKSASRCAVVDGSGIGEFGLLGLFGWLGVVAVRRRRHAR